MSDEAPEEPRRLYTVEEANGLLPKVAPLVEGLRDAQAVMEELHDQVMNSVPTNGGGPAHRAFVDATERAQEALDALNELGIVVRDPGTGLIDFPAERDGRLVFLCWKVGEDAVAWWHPPETGFAGRQPL